jgi:hypothetical protein
MAWGSLSGRLLEFAGSAALGAGLLLAWVYALSLLGFSCPSWDPRLSIVPRVLLLPLGYGGALLWALLLLPPSFSLGRLWLAAPLLAFALTLFLGDPLPLALLSFFLAFKGRSLEALPAGIVAVELVVLLGLAAYAYGLRLPLLSALPLHFSLYCFLVPAVPVLALLACFSPLLAPLAPRRVKLSLPVRGKLLLAFGLLESFLVWSVVYASALNPGARLVGVDAVTRYYPHAVQLLEGGLPSVLKVGYDRPLHYLLLFGLARALGPYDAVRALALTPLLLYTLASYLVARELWGGRVAGLAAAVAPVTYTATAGLFGGLYGNWTALAVALLACTAAVRWLRRGGAAWLVLYLFLLAATVGVHVYMGAVAFAALSLFLLLAAAGKGWRRRALAALTLQLVLALVGLYAGERYFSALGARGPLSIVRLNVNLWLRRTASVKLFSEQWWGDFCFAIYRYAATAALDPTVWLLTALAVAALGFRNLGGLLLASWMLLTALLALTAPFNLIYRSLFDFPYPLAEAVGLAYLASLVEGRLGGRAALVWVAALLLFKLGFALFFAVGLAS